MVLLVAEITYSKWDIVISYIPINAVYPFRLAMPSPYNTDHLFPIPSLLSSPSIPSSKLFPLPPIHIPRNPTQALQRPIPHLHTTKLNHPGIETQRRPYIVLDLGGRVVAHDEVVAVCVLCLMFAGLLWEVEDAPVFDAADGAAAAEDEGAGCACDSVAC
jgi:hypothetical protein